MATIAAIATHTNEKNLTMNDHEQRIAELEKAMHQMAGHYWRLSGRICALELIASLAVFDRANLEPNPFQWVQDYAKNLGAATKKLVPDVDDPSKGERLKKETTDALEEFLEQLLSRAGILKGAPSKREE